uniref:SFRICE_036487 n=1 Tax=Spodoptera frugiperda TaxID=7108 RepID=A0A2H1VP26_SPOFR
MTVDEVNERGFRSQMAKNKQMNLHSKCFFLRTRADVSPDDETPEALQSSLKKFRYNCCLDHDDAS